MKKYKKLCANSSLRWYLVIFGLKKKGIREIPESISFMTLNISELNVGVNISNITVIPSLSLVGAGNGKEWTQFNCCLFQ